MNRTAIYSPSTIVAWNIAAIEAKTGRAQEIEPAHLLLGLCKLCDLDLDRICPYPIGSKSIDKHELEEDVDFLRSRLEAWGIDRSTFRRRLRAIAAGPNLAPTARGRMHRSKASREVFERTTAIANADSSNGKDKPILRPHHLLEALLESPNPPWYDLFAEMGLNRSGGAAVVADPAALSDSRSVSEDVEGSITGRSEFGRDLTQRARDRLLSPFIGRQEKIHALAAILLSQRQPNPLLVGEAGVGKTSLVEGLVQWCASVQAPAPLRDRRFVELSAVESQYREEWEERLQAMAAEKVILFIDNLAALLSGNPGGAIVRADLVRGDLRCVATTTPEEYRTIARDAVLARCWRVVPVEEPTPEEAIAILNGLRPQWERHHRLPVSPEAIAAAANLSVRYLPDLRLPEKAIDLLDSACARARLNPLADPEDPLAGESIGARAVAAIVARRCNLPVERLTENERSRLLRLESELKERVIGQDRAVRTVTDAIRTAKAGLKLPHRPIGVFLFAGLAGTGKTELAKALAAAMFDDDRRFVAVDLSEFAADRNGIDRLAATLRTRPHSVVLFENLENGDPGAIDRLVQISETGELTDSDGRTVSFAETIVILKLSVGNSEAIEPKTYRQQIYKTLQETLRPKLLDSMGQIVIFYSLEPKALRQIIDKTIDSLQQRLAPRHLSLQLSEAAYQWLIKMGYTRELGVRELERTIDRHIVTPLGQALFRGRFPDGAIVCIEERGDTLVLETKEARSAIDD